MSKTEKTKGTGKKIPGEKKEFVSVKKDVNKTEKKENPEEKQMKASPEGKKRKRQKQAVNYDPRTAVPREAVVIRKARFMKEIKKKKEEETGKNSEEYLKKPVPIQKEEPIKESVPIQPVPIQKEEHAKEFALISEESEQIETLAETIEFGEDHPKKKRISENGEGYYAACIDGEEASAHQTPENEILSECKEYADDTFIEEKENEKQEGDAPKKTKPEYVYLSKQLLSSVCDYADEDLFDALYEDGLKMDRLKKDRRKEEKQKFYDFCVQNKLTENEIFRGFFLSRANEKKYEPNYNGLIEGINDEELATSLYYACRFDLRRGKKKKFPKRNLKKAGEGNRNNFFILLASLFIKRKIRDTRTVKRPDIIIKKLMKTKKKKGKMNKKEINAFVPLLLTFSGRIRRSVKEVYEKYFLPYEEVLTPGNRTYCLGELMKMSILNMKYGKAEEFIKKLENENDFTAATGKIMIKYKSNTLKMLFRKHKFGQIGEFKKIIAEAKEENNLEIIYRYERFASKAKKTEKEVVFDILGIFRKLFSVLGIVCGLVMTIISFFNENESFVVYIYICSGLILFSLLFTNSIKKTVASGTVKIIIAIALSIIAFFHKETTAFVMELLQPLIDQLKSLTGKLPF